MIVMDELVQPLPAKDNRMSLKTRKKLAPLTEVQEKSYLKRKEMAEEIGRLSRRIKELESDRNKIDAKLAPVFETHGNRRTLANGTIVERKVIDINDQIGTKEMVGKVIRTGYSYPKYIEVAGT